jgi:hypothetical protein
MPSPDFFLATRDLEVTVIIPRYLSRSYGWGAGGQDFRRVFRDGGAIDKGDRKVIGGGGAVIKCFRISHFEDFAENSPRDQWAT